MYSDHLNREGQGECVNYDSDELWAPRILGKPMQTAPGVETCSYDGNRSSIRCCACPTIPLLESSDDIWVRRHTLAALVLAISGSDLCDSVVHGAYRAHRAATPTIVDWEMHLRYEFFM